MSKIIVKSLAKNIIILFLLKINMCSNKKKVKIGAKAYQPKVRCFIFVCY
jgi:hypothetical protein